MSLLFVYEMNEVAPHLELAPPDVLNILQP